MFEKIFIIDFVKEMVLELLIKEMFLELLIY